MTGGSENLPPVAGHVTPLQAYFKVRPYEK
jgi:hypothetical protein